MVVIVRQFPPVGTQQPKHRVGRRSQSHVYLVDLALLRSEAVVVYIVSFQPALGDLSDFNGGCIVRCVVMVVSLQRFRCLPLGYREFAGAFCISVPYYNVIVSSGQSSPM